MRPANSVNLDLEITDEFADKMQDERKRTFRFFAKDIIDAPPLKIGIEEKNNKGFT